MDENRMNIELYNNEEDNISHKCRLENIDKTRNYFIEEINQNELMSKKDKKPLYGFELH